LKAVNYYFKYKYFWTGTKERTVFYLWWACQSLVCTRNSTIKVWWIDQKWRIERDNRCYFLVWTHTQKILECVIGNTWQYLKKPIELINWLNYNLLIFSLSKVSERFLISLTQVLGYGQYDITNALKHFLINQFVKFFFLIDPSNASKHL